MEIDLIRSELLKMLYVIGVLLVWFVGSTVSILVIFHKEIKKLKENNMI